MATSNCNTFVPQISFPRPTTVERTHAARPIRSRLLVLRTVFAALVALAVL